MKVLSKLKSEPGLWLSEADIPEPGHSEVRIKILKTAICGTDLHIYKWDDWAKKTIPVPMHVGHEFVGVIDKLGEGILSLSVGDRVSGEGHITCGYCRNCRAGRRHLCRNTLGLGVNRPGAFAEYLVLPSVNVIKLPDDITNEQGAILDPYGNAVHSALEFSLVGEDVLITGAGPIGLMCAQLAKHVGARHVVITDVNDYRLKLASEMGVKRAINTSNTDLRDVMKDIGMTEGFDVGLEMSGNKHAFQGMLDVMNNGGKIAALGIPSENFPIDWSQLILKSLTIKGIYGRRMFETWYYGISLLQRGVNITPVITDEYDYSDFRQAFEKMLSGNSGKVILNWA